MGFFHRLYNRVNKLFGSYSRIPGPPLPRPRPLPPQGGSGVSRRSRILYNDGTTRIEVPYRGGSVSPSDVEVYQNGILQTDVVDVNINFNIGHSLTPEVRITTATGAIYADGVNENTNTRFEF